MKNNVMSIEVCLACMVECEKCIESCLTMKGHEECVRLCRDCADLCDLYARFSARNSQFASLIWDVCLKSCEACLNECNKHDSECCKKCAAACERCIEANTK